MHILIGIERLTAIAFIVTGLSHITAPREWARFFIAIRDRSAVPGFVNAYVHAPLGLLILGFHWVWTWPGIVVTLSGCALTLKGTINFIWPRFAKRSLARVSEKRAWQFRIPGVVLLILGLWIGSISFNT